MAKNPDIQEHMKHKRQNSIEGDPATILVTVLEELSALRDAYDALEARVKKLEK